MQRDSSSFRRSPGAFVSGILAFAVAFAAGTGSARATTIDFSQFDFLANFTPIAADAFDSLGVKFDQPLFKHDSLDDLSDSGGAGVAPGTLASGAFQGPVTGFFFGPVTSVNFISAWVGDEGISGTDIDTVTLEGFDALNNLVDSDTFTSLGAQELSISGPGIVSFRFTFSDNLQITPNGSALLDDFTFEAEQTQPPPPPMGLPEPGTLFLLGTGLFAIAGVGRRQQP